MTFLFIVSGILIHRTSRRCHRKIQRSCRSQVGQGSQSLVSPAPAKGFPWLSGVLKTSAERDREPVSIDLSDRKRLGTENWGDFTLHVKLIWLVAIDGGEKVIDHFSGRPFP